MTLSRHSDAELLSEARRLLGAERKLTALLVIYLAEIEDRRLHLVAGYSSMFDFCVRGLGLSENEAFRRIAAARLGRRFPIVHSLLASGAVHLSTLELLREHLTDENHEELLASVSGKTKREVDAVVIERAIDLLLSELERSRLKRTKRPRAASSARDVKPSAGISRATRRKVFERDGLQCTYVSPDGRRCEAHAFLELDHKEPRALGGQSDSENLRVLCRAHNQLAAERVFGRETIQRARHFGRPKRMLASSSETSRRMHVALTGLGFGATRARHAIAELQRLHPREFPSLEEAVREAILVATRAYEKPRQAG